MKGLKGLCGYIPYHQGIGGVSCSDHVCAAMMVCETELVDGLFSHLEWQVESG